MNDLDLASRTALWRQRAAEGTLSLAETREALDFLRAGRLHALTQGKEKKVRLPKEPKAPKKAKKSGEDLLGELGEL